MSESNRTNGPSQDNDVTIDFGSHFTESDLFTKIFHEGMDLVDGITRGEPPANPDRIVTMKLAQ